MRLALDGAPDGLAGAVPDLPEDIGGRGAAGGRWELQVNAGRRLIEDELLVGSGLDLEVADDDRVLRAKPALHSVTSGRKLDRRRCLVGARDLAGRLIELQDPVGNLLRYGVGRSREAHAQRDPA